MINYRHLQRKQKIIQSKYFNGEEIKELNPFDSEVMQQDTPFDMYKSNCKEDVYATVQRPQHVTNSRSIYNSPSPKKTDTSYKHSMYK